MPKHLLHLFAVGAVLLSRAGEARAEARPDGPALYKTECVRCHGSRGQGTKRYKKRLEGDLSVAQLADLLRRTMPEDDPGSLSAEDAKAVSAYIHGAFYSSLARERDRPARIELARLTVGQYRQAVADVVGTFRPQAKAGSTGGLRGEYFKGRGFRPQDRVLERADPQVDFDFGTASAVPGKAEPHAFSVRWNGSLLAPETGEYQFVVRTPHAARLWVNDKKVPLIDAWVKSGKDTEFKASLFLIAGRLYPVRLEYTKAKQGVDDSAKKKKPPAVASSITLLWRVPSKALEAIPARDLSAGDAPEVYVCGVPFPPDDRSYGWERGTTISKEWTQAATNAALETAGYVAARLDELTGSREKDKDRDKKLRAFALAFAERAFRRPLTDGQKAILERLLAAKDSELAIKRVALFVLESPSFLYREVGPKPDGFDVASRLSFGLWDALPDRELLKAAQAGELSTPEGVRRHAERMLIDPRARAKLRGFLLTWLKADGEQDVAKDPKKFPGFDAAVVSDLRTSLELFLDDVLSSDAADFRRLLLSEDVYLNGRLSAFYGGNLPKNADFRKVEMDDKRIGVLSHPYLMSRFADTTESSPIHRGVFVARSVLGVALRQPPEAVAPLAPDLHPRLSTRERVVLQTSPTTCMSCHGVINSLGFSLENFDAVGRFRASEKDRPVDASGTYLTRDGKTVRFGGARELAGFLADSPEVHSAFVEQMLHYLVQQPVAAFGPDAKEELHRSFVAKKFHLRELAVDIMTRTALKPRPAPPPPKSR